MKPALTMRRRNYYACSFSRSHSFSRPTAAAAGETRSSQNAAREECLRSKCSTKDFLKEPSTSLRKASILWMPVTSTMLLLLYWEVVLTRTAMRMRRMKLSSSSLSRVPNAFPTKAVHTIVDYSCDFYSDHVDVVSGDDVCMAVFEDGAISLLSKMPKDLDLYFVQDDGTNQAVKTTLHTSCSKPIYSPYAVRLDDCET